MKIGILTFQADINYGTVLQAYAMQTHLESMGYEAVIIDKIEDPDNRRLLGPLRMRSVGFWLKLIFRSLVGCEDIYGVLRPLKTMRFFRKYYKRTPYHFFKWSEAPKDLGVDLITIGSDQVWNHTIVDPPDYLLKEVDASIPGIAYSASVGEKEFAPEWLDEYRAGFKRLVAIGVREREAKEMIERLGYRATHVVDPTLLVDPVLCWGRFVRKCTHSHGRRRLFCYFLDEDFRAMLPMLQRFAEAQDADVDLFLSYVPLSRLPHGVSDIARYIQDRGAWKTDRIRTHLSAAPDEFVERISGADWVVTNSFHGLMMATVFRREIRVLRPSLSWRKKMSSRTEEFVHDAIEGPVMQDSLEGALRSIIERKCDYNEEWIAQRRKDSDTWLRQAIELAVGR